jgi:Carboxypeptidase regulatory-like domain
LTGVEEPQSATSNRDKSRQTAKLGIWNFANWVLWLLPYLRLIFLMLIKSIQIGFVGLVLSITSAWAGPSGIQGVAKDATGQPIRGADIRIEARNGERLIRTVKTDAKGRYDSDGLPAGTYRVTLVVSGTVKTSINNAKIGLGEPTQLNFDLTSTPGSHALPTAKKGTHWVWLPPFTGSRLPGRWIEVDDKGSWAAAHASSEDVIRISGEELQRTVHSKGIPRGR